MSDGQLDERIAELDNEIDDAEATKVAARADGGWTAVTLSARLKTNLQAERFELLERREAMRPKLSDEQMFSAFADHYRLMPLPMRQALRAIQDAVDEPVETLH